MKVIGITGGVGAGKSTVLEVLREQGAYNILADEVGHLLMQKGQACYDKIIEEFGDSIIQDNGEIDRKVLSKIVFEERDRLEVLNGIIHPAVKQYIIDEIDREAKNYKYIVIEAALLIEEHYDKICDELWYIYASKDVRIDRVMTIRGYSLEKAEGIISNQLTEEEFASHCNRTIDNNQSLEITKRQIIEALEQL